MPRRLMRFYRGKQAPPQQKDNPQEAYNQNQEPGFYSEESNEEENNYFEGEKKVYNDKRNALDKIPSMDYEDLDEKNANEIRKYEQKNAESQLALKEIEKFKKENKRMPTKEETEKIAENLFTQLKENPINYSGIKENEDNPVSNQRLSPSQRRLERIAGKQEGNIQNAANKTQNIGQGLVQPQMQQEQNINQDLNVKDLFAEERSTKNKKDDEFDLGLDEEDDSSNSIAHEGKGPESIEDIEEISMDEGLESCPNCKKSADKVIYCSKCGFAFCKSCAKKQGNESFCPKCSNKIKV